MNNSLCRIHQQSLEHYKTWRGNSRGLIHRQGSNENSAVTHIKEVRTHRRLWGSRRSPISRGTRHAKSVMHDYGIVKWQNFRSGGLSSTTTLFLWQKVNSPEMIASCGFLRGHLTVFALEDRREENIYHMCQSRQVKVWCHASFSKFMLFDRHKSNEYYFCLPNRILQAWKTRHYESPATGPLNGFPNYGLKCIDLDLHFPLPRCDCERLSQRYRFPPRQKEAIIKPTADFHLFCGSSLRPVEGFGPIWCEKPSFCVSAVDLARVIFCPILLGCLQRTNLAELANTAQLPT